MGKVEVVFYFGDRESSGMVGYCYLVVGNWVCDGDIIFVDCYLVFFEVDVYYCFQIGVIEFGIGFCVRDFFICQIIQCQVGVGFFDIFY